MNKLAKMIESLEYEDLLRLQKDFEKGTLHNLIAKRIYSHKSDRLVLCPICSGPIKEGDGYHLEFGSRDLRKKATFDGIDCLEYFLVKIRK